MTTLKTSFKSYAYKNATYSHSGMFTGGKGIAKSRASENDSAAFLRCGGRPLLHGLNMSIDMVSQPVASKSIVSKPALKLAMNLPVKLYVKADCQVGVN
jgi:hypothetical protein